MEHTSGKLSEASTKMVPKPNITVQKELRAFKTSQKRMKHIALLKGEKHFNNGTANCLLDK